MIKEEGLPVEQSNPEKGLELIGTLNDAQKVFNTPSSHVHDNPELPALLSQALGKIDSAGRDFFIESIDFGKDVGFSRCIETLDNDDIIYAQREGRQGFTRFVKNREPVPTSFVTVILKKIPEGYKLITAFVGPQAEREPWDKNIVDESERDRVEHFWKSHAIVW